MALPARYLVSLVLVIVLQAAAGVLGHSADENPHRYGGAPASDQFDYARDLHDKEGNERNQVDNFYSYSAVDINGEVVHLEKFAGMVTLVVNVASECGYTASNYHSLVQLQQTLGKDHFVVLAFPCNQFGEQEPGENWQVKSFAQKIYHVNFPMFSKINVLGKDVPDCWKFLIRKAGKKPDWNFWKYLVGPDGSVLNAWGPRISYSEIYRDVRDETDKLKTPRHTDL